MSTYGDYKAYRKYEHVYEDWKHKRDILDAKRVEYLKQNPELKNEEDIQRARVLLRAIDVMDEYSQKRAEDMEVATQTVVSEALYVAMFGGAFLGLFLGKFQPVRKVLSKLVKPIENILGKGKQGEINKEIIILKLASVIIGGLLGGLCAFPLMSWAAKTEVSASRKGRFEAMDQDLDNPNGFAILTPEQMKKAELRAKTIKLEKKNKIVSSFKDSWKTMKDLVSNSSKYKAQRLAFLKELEERKLHLDDNMSPEEIQAAKRDQQLLTKIVEKIDIASQDYAENTELATEILTTSIFAFDSFIALGLEKILNKLNVKSASKISAITGIALLSAMIGFSIFSASIQKEASRVGRFKVKQELMKHPEQLVYVDDEKANSIENVKVQNKKKDNIFKFLKQAWKDNKEYKHYLKTNGEEEKQLFKAIEELELEPEQIKNATTLQKNTFRTFNKIDENSQKYAESIEALGQSIAVPISLIFTGIGAALAPLLAFKGKSPKNKIESINGWSKTIGIILLSTIPSILINAYITKEQKKASRIADMMAINELSDYREFRA